MNEVEDACLVPPVFSRYGSTEGLETAACTAGCPVGKFIPHKGANSSDLCIPCPLGFRGGPVRGVRGEGGRGLLQGGREAGASIPYRAVRSHE